VALDRQRFDAMLAGEGASRGVVLYSGSRFTTSRQAGQGRWRLGVQTENGDGISIETGFVVDLTGRRAVFARQQQVRRVLLDQLLGVFVFFRLDGGAPFTETYTLVEA